jgi:hypothetical protein
VTSPEAEARAFLTSPWSGLLAWLIDPEATEALLHHGEVKASYRRNRAPDAGWAWAIWRDGLHYERGNTWGGWDHRPRSVIAWADLHAMRDAHPVEMAQIAALAEGRGHPRRAGWRWFMTPSIVTNWGGWHHDYYTSEMDDDYYDVGYKVPGPPNGYADRLNAWLLATQIAADLRIEPTDLIEWAEALA